MIPKMTSHELNNILDNANTTLNNINSDIKNIKNNISKKMKIMRYEYEYLSSEIINMENIKNNSHIGTIEGSIIDKFVLPDNLLSNSFEKYGCTSTPKFKNAPSNVFNIIVPATGEAFYRDIAEVAINNIVKDDYKSILMHDNISYKDLFFDEISSDNPELKISITLDSTKTLGNTYFNMIELDTFLNGSFDINYIKIYTDTDVYDEYNSYENAGKMRITLDKEYSFSKVELSIIPKFSTQVNGINVFPIGIKHIYFYNSKFTSNSFTIATIENDDFIDTIYDEVLIKTPNGTEEISASKEGITFYLSCTKDINTGEAILSSLQEPSTNDLIKPISINTKKIYAKIPLKNKSIVGYTFKVNTKLF